MVSHGKIYENVCAIKRRESLCIVGLVIILQNIQHIIDEYIFLCNTFLFGNSNYSV